MSLVVETFWFYALFVLWIAATIGAIIHLATRVRPPVWTIVAVSAVFLLVPVITVAVYWLVVAVRRLSAPPPAIETTAAAD
jgi:hypothetical protein